jgi:IS30 family transposase
MHPNDPAHHISAETIYASIYLTPRGELRSELISQLRRNHAKRMPRARGANRQSKLVNPVSIDQRDPVVGERTTPGHWEADLIKGAYNRSAIGTIVERQSRFLLLSAVGGCTAAHVLKGFTARLKTVPSPLLQTLTYDRGSEMACHEALAKRFDMAIYFCDPHAPWQRGSNENMNGLVRQFLPKGMDLSSVTPQKLAYIEMALNTRPRKVLNFATPLEVMNALKSGVSFEQAIALP